MITDQEIQKAAEIIKNGGIVVYPTETAYGIAVNALDPLAVQKLYDLKGRDYTKPTHICVLSIEEADRYGKVDSRSRQLGDTFLPGPLTLVIPTRGVLPHILETAGGEERGIRIPSHPVAQRLIHLSGVPITACSANLASGDTPYTIETVKASFGENVNQIDMFLDVGTLPETLPSTLVSLMNKEISILRPGPISLEELTQVLANYNL